MNNNGKYKATLMKKIKLHGNKYLFEPVKTILGEYDNETGIFDAGNEMYLNILERSLYTSDEEYGVVNVIPKNKKVTENTNQLFYFVDASSDNLMVSIPYDMEGNANEYKGEAMRQIHKEMYSYIDYDKILASLMDTDFTEEQLGDLYNHYLTQLEGAENVVNYLEELLPEFEELKEHEENSSKLKKEPINVLDLHKKVTQTLISQDKPALEVIATISSLDWENESNSGILVTGSSGVGKTRLLQLIAKNIDRPFLLIDSTQLTTSGYTGKDIENYLWELYVNCGYDLEKAEHAIVFFDEIDKKRSSKNEDPSGQGVLNSLLKFLDGTTYQACANSQYKEPGTYVDINTSKMIVLAGGAFDDLYHSTDKKILGFDKSEETKASSKKIKDFFTEKGDVKTEFIGRFSTVVHLNDLNTEDYIKILNESNESPIKQAQKSFGRLNIELKFTDKCIEKLAKNADEKGLGVRGLQGDVRHVVLEPFIAATDPENKFKKITITEETVDDNTNYQFVKRKNK